MEEQDLVSWQCHASCPCFRLGNKTFAQRIWISNLCHPNFDLAPRDGHSEGCTREQSCRAWHEQLGHCQENSWRPRILSMLQISRRNRHETQKRAGGGNFAAPAPGRRLPQLRPIGLTNSRRKESPALRLERNWTPSAAVERWFRRAMTNCIVAILFGALELGKRLGWRGVVDRRCPCPQCVSSSQHCAACEGDGSREALAFSRRGLKICKRTKFVFSQFKFYKVESQPKMAFRSPGRTNAFLFSLS